MKVFVTGAFGNIGSHTVDALLAAGHEVRALGNGVFNRKRFPAHENLEVITGDLRDRASLNVKGVDAVAHLGYVIPPGLFKDLELAEAVNIGGTKNIIQAIREDAPDAKLLFASSLDVYGDTSAQEPPRRVTDPIFSSDAYSGHKVESERLVKESGLNWGMFRFADVPPLVIRGPEPIMFEIPLAQRIHALHPFDAGFATASALADERTWGKLWHIGGDKSCELRYGEYLARLMKSMGMGGPLPEAAFTRKPYWTDWLDTSESQAAWKYQRHSFDDLVRDISALLGWKKPFTALARPFVRRYMLSLSPYLAAKPG
jgi:nucleoside-diphosphate-sugar epimerase